MRFSACMQQVASAIQLAVHGLFACFAAVDQCAIERVNAKGLPLWIYGQSISIDGICQVGFIALHDSTAVGTSPRKRTFIRAGVPLDVADGIT